MIYFSRILLLVLVFFISSCSVDEPTGLSDAEIVQMIIEAEKAEITIDELPENSQNSIYDENKQINLYINFLKKFKKVKFDAIGLSFVQSGEIINKIKKQFPKYIVVAKIENIIGVKNVNNICKAADSIMIDRGDLSAEI